MDKQATTKLSKQSQDFFKQMPIYLAQVCKSCGARFNDVEEIDCPVCYSGLVDVVGKFETDSSGIIND